MATTPTAQRSPQPVLTVRDPPPAFHLLAKPTGGKNCQGR